MLIIKKIFLGFLIIFLLFGAYAVHAGVAVVQVESPDTQLWIPVPIALGQLAASFIKLPLSKREKFRELLQYRELLQEGVNELVNMPDADLVEIRKADEHVLIYKRGNHLLLDAYNRDDEVKIRIPIQSVQRLLKALSEPSPDLGDLIASLELPPSDDVLYVKTKREEVRISIW